MKDRTPKVVAVVRDAVSELTQQDITVRLDGTVLAFGYDASRDEVTARVREKLQPGLHTVTIIAVDEAGNRAERSWQFRVQR